MSNTNALFFTQQVYRWLVSMDIIENAGEINQKSLVSIPTQQVPYFQSGFKIAEIIKLILLKNGESASESLNNIKKQGNKSAKGTNWNFIWLSFEDLRLQFDNRIKDLILQGETTLISEVVKQLYERDDNKNEREMKQIVIKRKEVIKKEKTQSKQIPNQPKQSGTLDIKKINLSKNPDDSQSSLEFLILLLTQSLRMSIQEVLGLFTNQNKYLAHLIVKGINQDYTGVILFYTLLNKHYKKLKSFCDEDVKDAESCLYAIKPGFISKNQKVAQLAIQIFLKVGNVYEWFVSETGKGSVTLFLGIKRHPQLLDLYFDLLMETIKNEQAQFFTQHFKKCFRDPYEMIEICTYLIPQLSNCFFRQPLIDLGILAEWIDIALNLFQTSLDNKVLSYKFIGEIMNYFPDVVQANEQYLSILQQNWKQRKLVEFIHLVDQLILIFQKLTSEKNHSAKKLYQIILQIFQATFEQQDKRNYLLSNFIQVVKQFPSIPTYYLTQLFKQPKMRNFQNILMQTSVELSNDSNCIDKIGQVALKFYASDSVCHYYLANLLYKMCLKTLDQQVGRNLILKIIKGCLNSYAQVQITKKNPKIVKQQPMFGIQRGNSHGFSSEEQTKYLISQKMQKNWISLIQKLSQLVIQSVNEDIQKAIKQQLLQTNSYIKKNNYKVGSRQISNILQKKFGITKDEEIDHDEDYRNRKSLQGVQQSAIRKKSLNAMVNSRYAGNGNTTFRKQFNQVVQKRKREEEQKKFEQEKKIKQQEFKKILVKKQLEKTNLLRGFALQAQIKEDGFWQKFNKDENKQLQLYPLELMEAKDVEIIQNLFKNYHRLLRYLFLKYTASMYTIKQSVNFQDNKKHKQTISAVQLIKFLKQYKMYFLTNNTQIQNLVRDINVKLINRRQTQQLDFSGFQQFIIQFCCLIFTKAHTITAKSPKGQQNIKRKLVHLSHSQLVAEWFLYLRTVFIQKGQKTAIFDEPQAAYFNETEVIKEFNKKLQNDPTFILPEGYKKVTDKIIIPQAKITSNILNLNQTYLDVMQVLDEILFESGLKMHIIQAISKKQTKVRVKPHAFVNVKAKLLDSSDNKPRALSSIIEKKAAIPPVKMLQKKNLTFGMKMGLSYVSYKDKLLGQQVAYVIDDMLDAVQNGKNTIEKQKVNNEILKKRKQDLDQQKKEEEDRERKRKQRKGQLEKMKKQIQEKKEKQLLETKEERQKKQKQKQDREKRLKDDKEKYLEEQKQKLKEKKQKEQEEKKKKEAQIKNKKQQKVKVKEQFKNFNTKQIQKFKKQLETQSEKKKKQQQAEAQQKKKKQEMYKKLRAKIHQKDKKAIQIKQRTNEQILLLFNSNAIKNVFNQFQDSIKGLFDFLMANTYVSLTEKKLKNQIVLQTWHYFNLVFRLSPIIISAKQLYSVFRALTKDKQISKDFHTGLSFQEFKQALLRVAILHKSIFNKISQKIKEDDMTQKQINDVINKDIEQKQKNQFDQPKQIDVKSLLKEQDIKKQYYNHYGDISKVNDKTLRGLVYYLKVPRDKQGQQNRWRQILTSKVKYNVAVTQQLKEKLNEEYSLKKQEKERQKQRMKKKLNNSQTFNNNQSKMMQNQQSLNGKQNENVPIVQNNNEEQ